MGGERRKFTREFKWEAVRLAESGDRPVTQVAENLGLDDQSVLRRWIKQHQEDPEQPVPGKGRPKDRDQALRAARRAKTSWISKGCQAPGRRGCSLTLFMTLFSKRLERYPGSA
jgi:transposase